MAFLVPDDPDKDAAAQPEEREPQEDAGPPKAQLDVGGAGRTTRKVDLDLDDAPFLEEEEAPPEPVEEPKALAPIEEPRPKAKHSLLTNKFFYIGLAVLLVAVAVAVKLLFFKAKPAPPPEPPPEANQTQEAPPPPEPPKAEPPQVQLKLAPFLIEQRDQGGEIRFLDIRVTLTAKNETLAKNFAQETVTVRNAIFYYLKNKDLQFLTDETNSERLKRELLAVVNQYMGAGQFDELLFEQYMVK